MLPEKVKFKIFFLIELDNLRYFLNIIININFKLITIRDKKNVFKILRAYDTKLST